jgi:hypothetical protein
MSKLSFSKSAAPVVEAEEVQQETTQATTSQAVVPYKPRPVATALQQADDFSGEWLRTDVRLPRINLVQKVSDNELVRNFGIGAFTLAREVKLSDGETPLIITALAVVKDLVQKIPFDSGESAAIFRTEEEVINAGGSLNYKDVESGNYFQPRAHIEIAIGAPEGLDDNELALFPFDYEGTPFALALYTVASSAYTSFAKELATFRSANKVLRQGLRYGNLRLTAETRKRNTKSWFVPVARFNGANSPELIEFFETIEPALRKQG